jgi:hypothetical protein
MTRKRVAIIGAGLCGSVLAARLRNRFDVTVIEQARTRRPLYNEISCSGGGVNTTINRAAGLGGTTSYWHNALIRLSPEELRACGLDPSGFAPFYQRAEALFLSTAESASSDQIRDTNQNELRARTCAIAHMVVPHARANIWHLAERRYPGDGINVVFGRADRLALDDAGKPEHLVVHTDRGPMQVAADHYIFSAGGLATPALLATTFGLDDALCEGYHDHPMAYVAKARLSPSSILKKVSSHEIGSASVRTGFVYEADGMRAVFYLRPALSLDLKPITGDARYLLSDLRNDPFSPRKILQLLGNLEALREAILFKTKAGFTGDFYSVLMLGEQQASNSRGIQMVPHQAPLLNWGVTPAEDAAYQQCLKQFIADMSADVVETNVVPAERWDYRTAAHHSGAAARFLRPLAEAGAGFFDVADLPNTSICDASLLRRGGIANSGLTLVALSHQLADALIERGA